MTSRSAHASGLPRLGALVYVVAFVACGEASRPAEAHVTPSPSAASPATASSPLEAGPPDASPRGGSLPPGVPDTAAGRQLAWVIASFAQPPSGMDLAPHFTPDFTSHEPVRDLVMLFGKLGVQLAPLTIDRVEPGSTPERLTFNDTGAEIDDKRAVAATIAAPDFLAK